MEHGSETMVKGVVINMNQLEIIIASIGIYFVFFYTRTISCSQVDKNKGRGNLNLPKWLRMMLFFNKPNPFRWQTVFVQFVLIVLTIGAIPLILVIPSHDLRVRIGAVQIFIPIILCIILRVESRGG